MVNASSGMTHSTHAVITIRAPRRSPVARGSRRGPVAPGRRGRQLRSTGMTRANRSGTPTRSLRMKYPSKRTNGSSCSSISRWVTAMTSSRISAEVAA